jgi:serine/threonine protein phosphatase PrpC
MNANHEFQIGHDHKVCEDYALSEVNGNRAFAIICDGCSSSVFSDVGARILAHAARETLYETPMDAECFNSFGSRAIVTAQDTIKGLPALAKTNVLNATLLVSWINDNKLTVFMYGDGMLFHQKKDTTSFMHVELASGAPDYLAYWLDKFHTENYYQEFGGAPKEIIEGDVNQIDEGLRTKIVQPFEPVVYQAEVSPGDVISLCSDGINSFRAANNDIIPWKDLLPEFFGFKSTNGEFVTRRLRAFQRDCQKKQITHSDDISVASIVI